MAVAHEGLASLAVHLHEVGDLLALTNFLVQLHNLVEGSQAKPNLSRGHHSPNSSLYILASCMLYFPLLIHSLHACLNCVKIAWLVLT